MVEREAEVLSRAIHGLFPLRQFFIYDSSTSTPFHYINNL